MIDWTRVGAMQRDVGPAAFPSLVELFLDEIEALLMEAGNAPPTLRTLHRLMEAAGSIGLAELVRTCQAAALAMAAGDAVPPTPLIARCYAQSKQQLMAGLGDGAERQAGRSGAA